MRNRWRRWIPGPRHGLARGVAVYGVPRPDPAHVDELLGRCAQLRTWARARGFELDGSPEDLALLDQALDDAVAEGGTHSPVAAEGNEAGLFLGTVIIASIPGARWRLWPNGHPVVRLATGGDLDVVALADDRVSKGAPLLADIYAGAAADDPRYPALLRKHGGGMSGWPCGGRRCSFRRPITEFIDTHATSGGRSS